MTECPVCGSKDTDEMNILLEANTRYRECTDCGHKYGVEVEP